jgi:hypothetical protein
VVYCKNNDSAGEEQGEPGENPSKNTSERTPTTKEHAHQRSNNGQWKTTHAIKNNTHHPHHPPLQTHTPKKKKNLHS